MLQYTLYSGRYSLGQGCYEGFQQSPHTQFNLYSRRLNLGQECGQEPEETSLIYTLLDTIWAKVVAKVKKDPSVISSSGQGYKRSFRNQFNPHQNDQG